MYTEVNKLRGDGPNRTVEPLDRKGPTVRLLSQAGNVVTYQGATGDAESVPSHEFFARFREALPDEVEGYESKVADKAAKADKKPAGAQS